MNVFIIIRKISIMVFIISVVNMIIFIRGLFFWFWDCCSCGFFVVVIIFLKFLFFVNFLNIFFKLFFCMFFFGLIRVMYFIVRELLIVFDIEIILRFIIVFVFLKIFERVFMMLVIRLLYFGVLGLL